MHNKVVTIIERALRELGLDTLRFNFRGIGQSAGSFDEGIGESEDLAAVVDWARKVRPGAAALAGRIFIRQLCGPAQRASVSRPMP